MVLNEREIIESRHADFGFNAVRRAKDLLQKKITVPEDPQMVGAYGAALLAQNT